VSRGSFAVLKSPLVKTLLAWLEVLFCPYLVLCAIDQNSVPIFMSVCVVGITYLPFMYIEKKSHQVVWKTVNIWYTQLAFECRAAALGKLLLAVLEGFRDYVDLVFALYPVRFVERKLREAV
jgi:hypothetical protein